MAGVNRHGSELWGHGASAAADGVYRWMLHHKQPLRNSDGYITKWFGSSSRRTLRRSLSWAAKVKRGLRLRIGRYTQKKRRMVTLHRMLEDAGKARLLSSARPNHSILAEAISP
jgi:hypothetical protein